MRFGVGTGKSVRTSVDRWQRCARGLPPVETAPWRRRPSQRKKSLIGEAPPSLPVSGERPQADSTVLSSE